MSLRDELIALVKETGMDGSASLAVDGYLLSWVEQKLANARAETLEQLAQGLEAHNRPALMNPETLAYLAYSLSNFSPDPHWLERKLLEARQTQVRSLLSSLQGIEPGSYNEPESYNFRVFTELLRVLGIQLAEMGEDQQWET